MIFPKYAYSFQRVSAKIKRGLVFILLLLFLGAPLALAETGTVAIDNLKVRSGPSTRSGVVGTLRKGTAINIVGKSGACWYEIRYKNKKAYVYGCSGYVVMGTVGEDTSRDIQAVQSQARTISGQLSKAKKKYEQIAREERKTTRDINAIDKEISKLGSQERELKNQLVDLNQEIQTNMNELERVQSEIRFVSDAQSKRLVALYKMGRLGRAQLLGSATSMHDAVKIDAAIKRILEKDKEQLQKLAENAERQKELLTKLDEQKNEYTRVEKELENKKEQSAKERKNREVALSEIRKEKGLQQKTMKELQAASANLDRTIRDLQAKERRRQQELERKRKEAEAAERAAAEKEGRAPVVKETPPPRTQAASGFGAARGSLPMPARGNVVLPYGPYKDDTLKVSGNSKGIGIRVNIGDPVRAVYQGRVAYAGWLKGYGNMLILDHGDHYYTVYAHAQDLFKKRGDSVSAGEQIASAGDSGSVFGPQLYFEIRYYDKPQNPMQWLRR